MQGKLFFFFFLGLTSLSFSIDFDLFNVEK